MLIGADSSKANVTKDPRIQISNMQCDLLDLPVELKLMIVEELLRDEHVEVHPNDDTQLENYHKEIQDEPIKIYHDLINWSCTCSHFRNLLVPRILKTVRLVNSEKSGCSIDTLAKSPHIVHVQSLHFIGSALGDTHKEEPAFSDTEGIFPRSVGAVLCNLQRFPSLERLSIEFDYNFQRKDEWIYGMNLEAEAETPEQVLEAENSEAWRALMSKTYSALIQNKSPHFKHLDIRQLIWKQVSTFSHASFYDFLGHFERFTLSIHGESDELDHQSNLAKDYPALMGKMDKYFFNHLANVTTLSIKAPPEGPLGLSEHINPLPYAPLTLKADQMPLLTTLHLENIFASPELIDFLVGHKDTLEELVLRNCNAAIMEMGTYWSELFTSFFFAHPAKLRHLELFDCEMNLMFEEEEYEQVLAILQQDSRRIFFPYALLDKYGVLYYDEETSLEEFLEGNDQMSWDRLIGLVKQNAKKAMKSESKDVQMQAQST